MSGSVFDQLREAARRKAQELDEKYDLRTKIEDGVNAAAETVRGAGETARDQFGRLDEQYRVTENLKSKAAEAGEGIDEAARATEATAREVFGAARGYYERVEQAYSFSARTAGATSAVVDGYTKARQWIRENPGKTAVVTLSLIAGVRGSGALSSLGVTLLGSGLAGELLFHSALPVIGLRRLTETYTEYLRSQEARLAAGELEEAARDRLIFQQKMTKYVGAPLLGAFSVAAGATLIGAAFSGATVTGLPLTLLLGGNPLLNGVWFFANGVICISEGYRFFMIALADEVEVERVVREIQGLLTA
jgi:hypothetical protein